MRTLTRLFLLVGLLVTLGLTPALQALPPEVPHTHVQTVETTVYITRTGAKYHRGHCRYLRKSKYAIELQEAKKRGYTPCKVCRPPRSR